MRDPSLFVTASPLHGWGVEFIDSSDLPASFAIRDSAPIGATQSPGRSVSGARMGTDLIVVPQASIVTAEISDLSCFVTTSTIHGLQTQFIHSSCFSSSFVLGDSELTGIDDLDG
jgi:hypothetical protein